MKPVLQDKFIPGGNCLAACLASLLEVPLSKIPVGHCREDEDLESWWARVDGILYTLGWVAISINGWGELSKYKENSLRGYYILGGEAPGGTRHSVVCKNGKVVHDPMGPRAIPNLELKSLVWVFLVPLNPARNND